MTDAEVFVSMDIEADVPIPGVYSMLSFASAAYWPDKTLIDTFSANLGTLPEATSHPKTMAGWQTQPEAWALCRQQLQPPEVAMQRYSAWLKYVALDDAIAAGALFCNMLAENRGSG